MLKDTVFALFCGTGEIRYYLLYFELCGEVDYKGER